MNPRHHLLLASSVTLVLAACASARPARIAPLQSSGGLQAGIAAYQAGNYSQAEQALDGQAGADANAYLAAARAKQHKYAEAEGAANAALAQVGAHPIAAGALGESLVGLGRFDDAVARMGAVLAADRTVAYAYYWRGQAYYKKKQADKMLPDLENFLKLAPDAPEAGTVRQLLSALR